MDGRPGGHLVRGRRNRPAAVRATGSAASSGLFAVLAYVLSPWLGVFAAAGIPTGLKLLQDALDPALDEHPSPPGPMSWVAELEKT